MAHSLTQTQPIRLQNNSSTHILFLALYTKGVCTRLIFFSGLHHGFRLISELSRFLFLHKISLELHFYIELFPQVPLIICLLLANHSADGIAMSRYAILMLCFLFLENPIKSLPEVIVVYLMHLYSILNNQPRNKLIKRRINYYEWYLKRSNDKKAHFQLAGSIEYFNMQEVIACLKGLRNGVYYGGKVRLIHSIVMTILFKDINKKSLLAILTMSVEHATFLGLFVLLYKTCSKVLAKILGTKYLHTLLAGAVSGFALNQTKTPVKHQLVLYLLSRNLMGLCSILYKRLAVSNSEHERYGFILLAALCWGAVMAIFETAPQHLQPSLTSSMQFLYRDSDLPLTSIRDLIPFYVPPWLF